MLNQSILNLGSYASKTIARGVEDDSHIVSLSIGEPSFGPPPFACKDIEQLMSASLFTADIKRYEVSIGSPSLREAISEYYRLFCGLSADPSTQLLITNGGSGAIAMAILSISNPGDEIIIGDPSYMLYSRLITVLGRKPVAFIRQQSEGCKWDLELLSSMVTNKTAALIVNSPENPTGYVCDDDEMIGLINICESHGIFLIHDEVYDQFTFNRRHRPAAALTGLSCVIQINSMSKKFGVPGLRIGWMMADPAVISLAAKAQDYTTLAVCAFSERVAETLLRSSGLNDWFGEVREDLRQRALMTIDRLSDLPGIEFPSIISGGMFAFPNVEGLATRLGLCLDSGAGDAVTKWMLDNAKVAVVSGSVYGTQCSDAVRLVLCGPAADLNAAINRIQLSVSESL